MSKWPQISLTSRWRRVVLVPPSHDDDAAVASLRSDPVVLKYVPFLPQSITPEQWREKREANSKNDEIWNFHIHLMSPDNESPRFVGQCGIFNIDTINRHGEVGIIISSPLHRTGIATESLCTLLLHAFEHPELKLHRVEFVTGAHNVQMRSWFEKFRVEVEYRLREAWIDGHGGWIDAVGYSILESEWLDLKARVGTWLDGRVRDLDPHNDE